jgi:hypothetical protein
MSIELPKLVIFGASGGPQAVMIVKDGIMPGGVVPADKQWHSQALRLTGKYLKSDGPEIFTYDGTNIRANVHMWITAICDVRLDYLDITQKFLGFSFFTARFGQEYKSASGFVAGYATTAFADEMYPGDQLSVAISSDVDTTTVDGDCVFSASQLT